MDALELTRELIRKPSVTPDDQGCQTLIGSRLESVGFVVEGLRYGDVDNLWARHGTAAPLLCFAGHTDVVPPGPTEQWSVDPFAADVTDGQLTARGAADMKGSLAAMIIAAERFVSTYPEHAGSLAFLITSDEEGEAANGTTKVMETLDARGELIDWCVVGEPSSATALGDTVRVGRRGSLTGLMTLRGIQGHVAYPLKAVNPMHGFAQFVAAITEKPVDNGNEYFPPTTFQMVNVHCDAGAPNVVPGELRCRFNFRYSTEWTQESLSNHVEGIMRELKLDFDVTWKNAGMPFITETGRLTNAICAAVHEETGSNPELSTSGGTSDGRFIAPYGVDVVELGPLNETIHKVNETLNVADLPRLERIYYRIAELLLVERG
jgi:succinyl-diaminopimelate desuccinylase